MKERTNKEKLQYYADLMLPASKIFADQEVSEILKTGNLLLGINKAISKHADEVIEILALIRGVPVEEYEVSFSGIYKDIEAEIKKPEAQEFFTLLGLKTDAASSGSATENTEGGES